MSQPLLIRGATIHDGTGAPGTQGDVVVHGDRIAEVGTRLERPSGALVIDGDGLVAAPGFIDLHSHADFTLPAYPGRHQLAEPGRDRGGRRQLRLLARTAVGRRRVRARMARADAGIGPDIDWSWRTFGEYLDALDGLVRP